MQNTRTSKSLNAVIAAATFSAAKIGATHAFEDILFLELIAHRETLCYQLISNRLNSVQLQHIETQIRRIVSTPHAPTELSLVGISPELFYRDMVSAIERQYPDAVRISTIHALHFIVSDPQTTTSRSLAMAGLTIDVLNKEIAEYSISNAISPLLPISTTREQHTKAPPPHPLSKYGVEFTALAREGKIDPVIGRDAQTERVIEILSRRKKNNPILVGEAGVGKSAIVEGLALRIAAGDVPHTIRNKRLFSVDISALVAGTKFRGEFEERMQQLLTTLRDSKDAIIFIDEIHTIIGAGSSQGSLDTANILKPALARGKIQTIGATTIEEYRTHIESDSALVRRLQRVTIEPTTIEQSIEILQRIAPSYESHHRVSYTQEAIEACVTLSQRYISDRHLPDKAIDLLDEAGARASISTRESQSITTIDRPQIEAIITASTGIPAERLSNNEMERLRTLEKQLGSRVVGQNCAVERLSRTIRRSRVGLNDAARPIGVFLFVGPTGVGKTLLAKELSSLMYGEQSRNLIRIDMSEFSERHNVARLIGSPPGYVGYGEGGELSEAVRHNPYSVVLLDEVEKAHPDTFNLMLQIIDEGRLTDGAGRLIDFRNTIIIMTSNIGSRTLTQRSAPIGFATQSKSRERINAPEEHYRNELERYFAPEFINRIDDIIQFRALEPRDMEQIIEIELKRIIERSESLGYNIRITPAARRELASLGYHPRYGARALRRTLLERVEEPLTELIIGGILNQGERVVIERERKREGVRLRVA